MGLTSRAAIAGAACIGYRALALVSMLTAASAPGLPDLFERLPDRPLATELKATLRDVAGIVKEEQVKDVAATSWVAVTAGKEAKGNGTTDLLSEIGARDFGRRRSSEEGHW